MDRDKRWERTKLAWDAIVHGHGAKSDVLASEAIAEQYAQDKTDEFLSPSIFFDHEKQRINDGDVVLFFNFRADRARQLSEVFLSGGKFDHFETGAIPKVEFFTLTEYDETYDCPAIFPPETIKMTLGEAVAKAGKKQLRIAETEKYPHVSYFFNGGEETPYPDEDRKVIPSPKEVATYDLKPEMSSYEVEEYVLGHLKNYDLVIINFANPDMVGHTGVVEAAKKAVTRIDEAVQAITEETLKLGGKMRNADGSPHTAHTTNLVHLWYVADDAEGRKVEDGILADVAPTLLDMMGLEQPEEMTGKSLIK
jgi:2,3-bisphosphoglycerate-independent phosphoglycerate mutase